MEALGQAGTTERAARSGSLVDGAEGALRHWLASGRFRPGDRLPPEHEVATMLGVSRGTLRSALLRLEKSSEIVRRQGSGTFVGHTALPAALDERLERLEPYSRLAARRGLELRARDVRIERHPAGAQVGGALGLAAIAQVISISRTLLAGDEPVAVMFDAVHPSIGMPDQRIVREALENGRMVLDLLLDAGVPVAYARTRLRPALLNPDEGEGKLLGVRATVPALELEELIYAGRDERVAYSRDLFAPDALDVMVMRTLESTRPSPVVDLKNSRSQGRRR